MEFFKVPDFLAAFIKDGKYLRKLDALRYHHNCEMIDKVADLVGGIVVIAFFG